MDTRIFLKIDSEDWVQNRWAQRASWEEGGFGGLGAAGATLQLLEGLDSETGQIRFRGVRFQTPSSVSFSGLTEFRGANSVSSFQPFICVPKEGTHRVFFRRTHRVCPKISEAQ